MTYPRFQSFITVILPAAGMLAAASGALGQCTNSAIPGKFYEYYIIAQTGSCNGNNFTTLGSYPSINDFGQVGFAGQTTALSGNALWVGDGHMHPAASPINPGETGSSEIYDAAVQIGSAYPGVPSLVSKDSITTTSPATTSIRVWNTATADSYRYAGRGGPSQQFGAIFPYPSVNKNGDVAFMALDQNNPTTKYLVEELSTGTLYKTTVSVSVGEPVIDDADEVLLYTTASNGNGNFEMVLYARGLQSSTTIADGKYFTSIDSAPGLSRDGNIVAFQGNLNAAGAAATGIPAGPGIFAYWKFGSEWVLTQLTGLQVMANGAQNGLCVPGNTCKPGAELGYDEAGNAIYFNPAGYGVESRVAVTDVKFGGSGTYNYSFVVSFIGTPSEASRPNPVLKSGVPLFFSGQQGLWTIRCDVEEELGANVWIGHARTAIPVVQVGDRIGSNVVTAVNVLDGIANAAEDETGAVRTMRRGDHRVAFWASTATGQFIARGNHLDSDQDGLLDHWETTGIDMDQDGIVDLNLAAMGANVNERDLFLEVDWIAKQANYTYQPFPGVIGAAPGQGAAGFLESMFAKAPALNGTSYGSRIDGTAPASIPAGITMHIDGGSGTDSAGVPYNVNMGSGPLDGGSQIGLSGTGSSGFPEVIYFGVPNSLTVPGIATRAYQDVKDNYFGSHDKDGRELAFHYAVLGNFFGVELDSANANSWKVGTAGPNTLTSLSPLPASTSVGDVVKITGGTGVGEYGTVMDILNSTTVQIGSNWKTNPDHSSTFSLLEGSSGLSEVFFYNSPDANSLPGNDLIITFGGFSVPPIATTGVLGTPCAQWRTIAHELGHTLGLRHGGTNFNAYQGSDYLSLMSYSWQLECNEDTTVQSYSGATDPTFNDWGNLQENFSDSEMHLGNTAGLSFGTFPESELETPELNAVDYVNINGSIDSTPPAVAITSPKANANEGLTLPLKVSVTATDNAAVGSVTVAFDANGNGVIDPSELIVAKGSGSTYTASFPALSGAAGNRTITASAIDTSGNTATASISVHVEAPNAVPTAVSLSPSSATHGGASFTLTVNGTKFVSGCTVEWNGAALATTFVSGTLVTAKVPAADIAAAGTASVTVKNPAPGGGTSNALTFTIH